MTAPRDPPASWQDRYRDPDVVARYFEDRFSSPLGALLHARQTAAVERALLGREVHGILEVAAGPARFAPALSTGAARCVFVDRSLPMLRAARAGAASGALVRPAWIAGEASTLSFAAASFDLVLAFRFLRHLDAAERMRVYAELARVLRPGGELLFDAVNERVSDPLRRAAPGDYPVPDQRYSESSLRSELERTPFALREMTPVQRRYPLERRLQILIAPRSRRLAAWMIGLVERTGGEPLEWVVTCRRA